MASNKWVPMHGLKLQSMPCTKVQQSLQSESNAKDCHLENELLYTLF